MKVKITFYSVTFILQTKFSKILMIKKDWIKQLKDLNTDAEKMVSVLKMHAIQDNSAISWKSSNIGVIGQAV